MRKLIGDILDDIGCFFAWHGLERPAGTLARWAEVIDPARMED
jgi:hypothetical protein